jgi:protein ImuA
MAAAPAAALDTLRQAIRTDHGFTEEVSLPIGVSAIDHALGGGLARGSLHEIAPAAPIHFASAYGFALSLAARATKASRTTLLIQPDFAAAEGGELYGAGLDLFGLSCARLLILRVCRARDALFAMEEALKCHAVAAVIAEMIEDAPAADLTATRRLSLAARESGGFPLLLRHRVSDIPSAAATRWTIAATSGPRDAFGGIGRTAFLLSLTKNRRGQCGRWTLTWNHHDGSLASAADPVGLAATAADRPDRTARASSH